MQSDGAGFLYETGCRFYIWDLTMQMMKNAKGYFYINGQSFPRNYSGSLSRKMNRLSDVPLTTGMRIRAAVRCRFEDIFGLAYQSAAIGYYFGEKKTT